MRDDDRWDRYKHAVAGEALPAALVDLDAVEANVERLLAPIRAAGKRVRIATKSIRCPALVARVLQLANGDRTLRDAARGELARGAGRAPNTLPRGTGRSDLDPLAIGLMTYTAAETAFLAAAGERDLILAYPTLLASDAAHLARANRTATAAAMIDDAAQLPPLATAARAEGTTIPIVIDVDMSWRPTGSMHLGVRRSPLREPADVVALARAFEAPLRFHGVMGYEAQLAGLPDRVPAAWQRPFVRAIKRRSGPELAARRGQIVAALAGAKLPCAIVNGGGTGSVDWSSADAALTEVTIGSGFLCGHLFDGYRGLALSPALAFALQVVRRPAPGVVTCLGGGWIASGATGADRLPQPAWPHGCTLLTAEGAGEVQTPVRVARELALGDPIFFRPAKSGELAEHVGEYLLVRGDRVVERAPTYRGLGQTFLG